MALMLFATMIATVAVAYYIFNLNEVTAFWMAYVLTRPLGASLGDFMIQTPTNGGLGINMLTVNITFLFAIMSLALFEMYRINQKRVIQSSEDALD